MIIAIDQEAIFKKNAFFCSYIKRKNITITLSVNLIPRTKTCLEFERVSLYWQMKKQLYIMYPTAFSLQKSQKFVIFFIVDICLLTSLELNPKISNPHVISKVV